MADSPPPSLGPAPPLSSSQDHPLLLSRPSHARRMQEGSTTLRMLGGSTTTTTSSSTDHASISMTSSSGLIESEGPGGGRLSGRPTPDFATVAAAAPAAAAAPGRGFKLLPAAVVVLEGLAIKYALPTPTGITPQAWSLCAIFLSTILALILEPLPAGACALLAAGTCILTHTLTFQQTFESMANTEVIWLIVLALFLSKGFQKTGLGERVAHAFVRLFGSSPFGLALGLSLGEAAIAPFMPSTSARAGGVLMPVIRSLAEAAGSYPEDDASRRLLGSFLTQSQFQASVHSSSLFLTAAAQNLLCLDLAKQLGIDIPDPFFTWLYGAALPAIAGLVLTPVLVYVLLPPTLGKRQPAAQGQQQQGQQQQLHYYQMQQQVQQQGSAPMYVQGQTGVQEPGQGQGYGQKQGQGQGQWAAVQERQGQWAPAPGGQGQVLPLQQQEAVPLTSHSAWAAASRELQQRQRRRAQHTQHAQQEQLQGSYQVAFPVASTDPLLGGGSFPTVHTSTFEADRPPYLNPKAGAMVGALGPQGARGPLSRDEVVMAAALAVCMTLWVVGPSIGVSAVSATLVGVAILLCAGVLTWQDCLSHTAAWDTLIWFSVLIGMSAQLNEMGVIDALTNALGRLALSPHDTGGSSSSSSSAQALLAHIHAVSSSSGGGGSSGGGLDQLHSSLGGRALSALASAGQALGRKQQQQVLLPTPSASLLSTPLAASPTSSLPSPQPLTLLDPETLRLALQSPLPCSHWLLPFSLLHLSFFFVHYLFASQTAQVAAIYPAWCALMVKAGVPPQLAALTLAYNVNLFGSLTHYASGQAAIYASDGYIRAREVLGVGLCNGLLSLVLWGGLGMPMWKLLGWW